MNNILVIALGIIAGIFSGFFGLGGGVILIPAFVYMLGMSQHQAQGTTLALMVPPIGLLAAIRYYQAGDVNIKIAAFVCAGFFVGGLLGAQCASFVPDMMLKKIFAIFLIAVAVKMLISK